MTWQSIGLLVFVLTTFGTLAVLGVDLWLYATGREMITDYCRVHPWLAWIILTLECGGVIGLAIHFMQPTPIP